VYLVFAALGLPFDAPEAALDAPLEDADIERVRALAETRIRTRKPTAYLVNKAWFVGLEFYVDERVLVPRSPIAELIEQGFAPWLDPPRVRRVLDIGTGSGCIAIACACAFPGAKVDATDISRDALEVAQKNIAAHRLSRRVRTFLADLFPGSGQRYDLIVANPPYVRRVDLAKLPPEYRHEPRAGLAAGRDGLDVVRRIIAGAADHLESRGILVCEVGAGQAALERAYPELPFCWLEFERGGDGVFLLEAGQLRGMADAG
jgi:ribosomal protein L3 glutamine methyltransferase